MFRQVHKARCSSCGHIEKTSAAGEFISTFFLPNICSGCGEHMHSYSLYGGNDRPHWIHDIVKQKRVLPKRTRNPLTWLRVARWEDTEISSLRA